MMKRNTSLSQYTQALTTALTLMATMSACAMGNASGDMESDTAAGDAQSSPADAGPSDAQPSPADAAPSDAQPSSTDAAETPVDTCAEIDGVASAIGGPLKRYDACFYLSALETTCDTLCEDLGAENIASSVEDAYADHCDAVGSDDISTYFFENGNPGGWTTPGTTTTGHSLGYGYATNGSFYGKCALGESVVGTYPDDSLGEGLFSERSLVCACSLSTVVN